LFKKLKQQITLRRELGRLNRQLSDLQLSRNDDLYRADHEKDPVRRGSARKSAWINADKIKKLETRIQQIERKLQKS